MKKYKDIQSYIREQPKDIRPVLERLRAGIRKAAPKAEEAISYGIPTFKLNGNLVHFAAWKTHIGFYPGSSALTASFKKDLAPYEQSKGTVRFPLDKPLPLALIQKMVRQRVKENAPKEKKGSYTHYHKDGSVWAKGKLKGGTIEGYWEWFRKDGSKMRSGHFIKGKQVGEWITYDKKGKVVKVTRMK